MYGWVTSYFQGIKPSTLLLKTNPAKKKGRVWITAPLAQPLLVHQTPTVSAALPHRPGCLDQMQTSQHRARGGRGESSLDLGLFKEECAAQEAIVRAQL